VDTAFEIGLEFIKQFRMKYGRYLCSVKNLRTSKWWTQFENTASYISDEDASSFVKFIFKQDYGDTKMYPFILVSKKTRELYKDFKMVKTKPAESSVKPNVILTLRNILVWCKENNIQENKIQNFLSNRANIMKIENGTLYEPLFYFSQTFMNDRYIDNVGLRRGMFSKNFPEEYEALKKIFGRDFF